MVAKGRVEDDTGWWIHCCGLHVTCILQNRLTNENSCQLSILESKHYHVANASGCLRLARHENSCKHTMKASYANPCSLRKGSIQVNGCI